MESGGTDLVLEGPTSDQDWITIFHTAKSFWPDCVLERLDCGEAFVHRDQASADGADFKDGVMVHILVSEDSITIAHDDPPSQSATLGEHLYEKLAQLREGV